MKPSVINEIWSLWESMAECGQLSIGPKFSAQYDRLKIEVQAAQIKYQEKLARDRITKKKWLSKPENKAKVIEYQREVYRKVKKFGKGKSLCEQKPTCLYRPGDENYGG